MRSEGSTLFPKEISLKLDGVGAFTRMRKVCVCLSRWERSLARYLGGRAAHDNGQ